jgi:hypothetical protein
MKHDEALVKRNNILINLSELPRKILSLHGRADVAEFVLRDLSHERCFNLKKAAFFVDNPDFNCLKGVAAYFHEDNPTVHDGLWNYPDEFMDRIKDSSFNKKVRDLWLPSMQRVEGAQAEMVNQLGHVLEIEKPLACAIDIKHGNRGFLIFEKHDHVDLIADDYLPHGVSLLGFCPIY